MDKYYVYEVCISVVDIGHWKQLFIGFPDEHEVRLAITEALKVLTDALKDDPSQCQVLSDIYGNYYQLLKDHGLVDKPAAHPNGNTTRPCTYVGVIVGHIGARVLGHACLTKGARNDS